jgi:hypothetical protein
MIMIMMMMMMIIIIIIIIIYKTHSATTDFLYTSILQPSQS